MPAMPSDPHTLAGALERFFRRVAVAFPRLDSITEHLQLPSGDVKTIQGSLIGQQLWATPEGDALLDVALADPSANQASAPLYLKREAQCLFALAYTEWRSIGLPAMDYALGREEHLWAALRQPATDVLAVGIGEGILAPKEPLDLGFGVQVLPPTEATLRWAFERAWPTFWMHLPTQPYALLVNHSLVNRAAFGAVTAPTFGFVSLRSVREAVWLATGSLPRLGHAVSWENSDTPFSRAQHHEPEPRNLRSNGAPVADVSAGRDDLLALMPRLAVLAAHLPEPPEFAEQSVMFRHLRMKVGEMIESSDATVALESAFSLADGALRARKERVGVVPERFGLLCGADDTEARHFADLQESLNPIRNALAHGESPTDGELANFMSVPGISGGTSMDVGDAVRPVALDLIRRLYRSLLLLGINLDANGVPQAGLGRQPIRDLLRKASEGSVTALSDLRQATRPQPQAL